MPVNLEREYENECLQYDTTRKVDKTRLTDTRYRVNPEAEADLLNTSYYNLTKDKLWTRYTNLDKQKDQLQTSYNNLIMEKKQLQTSFNNLVEENKQVQSSYNYLDTKLKKLHQMFPRVVEIISLEWKPFNTSIYYFSTEKKNWVQSRQYCRLKEADLVIINSQKEEDFIIELLGNKSAWVGLIDKDKEKEWKWVDGTVFRTGNLSLEQPIDGKSKPHAGKISIEAEWKKTWISMPCAHEDWWVCEKIIFE
ncbi:hypothetical protein KOW79_022435 [Hemibagrus wyckioides]|uniref:C-type lectin domain-containing protein n=1 Tax=Hemibagrus wyckioides TaxID=337641 RepID=A0A9D3SCQ7_9TELE|nr:hypothetical protein KOW79_022435 [Hemibagrus wyckioides]